MAGAYALPSWPPETPWEGYLFALLIPFILRFIILFPQKYIFCAEQCAL